MSRAGARRAARTMLAVALAIVAGASCAARGRPAATKPSVQQALLDCGAGRASASGFVILRNPLIRFDQLEMVRVYRQPDVLTHFDGLSLRVPPTDSSSQAELYVHAFGGVTHGSFHFGSRDWALQAARPETVALADSIAAACRPVRAHGKGAS